MSHGLLSVDYGDWTLLCNGVVIAKGTFEDPDKDFPCGPHSIALHAAAELGWYVVCHCRYGYVVRDD